MCVIIAATEKRPTPEMVENAWAKNNDGGGVAWREGGKVHWQKGITEVAEMQEICAKLPIPFIAHFRIATVGGVKRGLTHPFPIEPGVSIALTGATKGAVLFHNGSWTQWQEKCLEAAICSNNKLPKGSWSDTRGMAFMTYVYGIGFMDLMIDQKGVYFSPDKIEVFVGRGWVRVNDIWCSNDSPGHKSYKEKKEHTPTHFAGNGWNTGAVSGYRYCSYGKCSNRALDGKTVCGEHDRKLQSGVILVDSKGKEVLGPAKERKQADPLPDPLKLEEAKMLFQEGGMSKPHLRRFEKLYNQLKRARSDKRKRKLEERLAEHTQMVSAVLVHG